GGPRLSPGMRTWGGPESGCCIAGFLWRAKHAVSKHAARCIISGIALSAPMIGTIANADEVVETTDGRRILLRPDGIYEMLSKIDPKIMEAALATARQWADDQTLIAYCFRAKPEGEMMARAFLKDRDEALARLRRAGAVDQQLRLVATTIAEHYRSAE